jgi:hypothetical protein
LQETTIFGGEKPGFPAALALSLSSIDKLDGGAH